MHAARIAGAPQMEQIASKMVGVQTLNLGNASAFKVLLPMPQFVPLELDCPWTQTTCLPIQHEGMYIEGQTALNN